MKAPKIHRVVNLYKKYPHYCVYAYDEKGNVVESGQTASLPYIVQDAKVLNKDWAKVIIKRHASYTAKPTTVIRTKKKGEL